MSKRAWILRPVVALVRTLIAAVVVLATVGASCAMLLGPGVGP